MKSRLARGGHCVLRYVNFGASRNWNFAEDSDQRRVTHHGSRRRQARVPVGGHYGCDERL
jgi:hypothetical protein